MTSFEFQGGLYRTRREMLEAIADAWLTADGLNDERAQREYLESCTDYYAAGECIEAWGLDQAGDEPRFQGDEQEPSHMAKHGYTRSDLADAFANLRNA